MPEGSPTDPAPESAQPETTEAPAEEETVATEERTPDEIETIWKNRVSQKDRSHAAAEASLRSQIEDLNRKLAGQQATEQVNMTEVERERARADAAEQRATEAERQRVVDLRAVKYAAAAEHLDPTELATIDEARLAALNARLTGDEAPPPPRVDPNSAPKRSPAPPAALRERSVEELEADLRRTEPEYLARLQNQ